MNFGLSKSERLCSRTLIERLYAEGHRLMAFPYSVHWQLQPLENIPCQVLIITSKRKFKHAVDRNRVKRLTRECYRLRKPEFYEFLNTHDISITLSLNYIHTDLLDYAHLEPKFDKLMSALQHDIEEKLAQ